MISDPLSGIEQCHRLQLTQKHLIYKGSIHMASIMASRLSIICLFLVILSRFSLNQTGLVVPSFKQKAYVEPGDINVGIMIDVHKYSQEQFCDYTELDLYSVIEMEAVDWYANKINGDQVLLPNISLGFVALDTCRKDLTALARSVYFVPSHDATCNGTSSKGIEPMHYDVIGIIGPTYSRQAIATASFLGLFEIPVLSTYATSDELADRNRFPYFMRLVSPDQYQCKAIVDVLQYMDWTYVSLVYSEVTYGENGARNIEQYTNDVGICIAFSRRIPSDADQGSFNTLLKELRSYQGARVVVLFMQPNHLDMLMKAAMDVDTPGEFLWLSSDNFVDRKIEENQKATQGTIWIGHPDGYLKEFADYSQFVTWINNDNPWINEYWVRQFDCVWNSTDPTATHCEQFHNISQSPKFTPLSWSKKVLGLYTYAHALDKMIRRECPTAFFDKSVLPSCFRGATLYQYMKNVSFDNFTEKVAFTSNGDILGKYTFKTTTLHNNKVEDIVIGEWDSLTGTMYIDRSLIQWDHILQFPYQHSALTSNLSEPRLDSVCSYPCARNEIYFRLELPCCWECRTCRENERTAGNRTTCETCPLLSWPGDDNPEVCVPITPTYLLFTDQLSIILLALAAIGMFCSLTVQVIYFTHSNKRLIKATSIELSSIILFGTLLSGVVVFFYVSRPTAFSCVAREVGFHMSVSAIYIPLMVKTTRIYRIFSAGKKGTRRPQIVSRSSQTFMITFLFIMQVLIITISELQAPSAMELRQPIPTLRYVEAACGRPLWGFLLPLSTNIAVVLVCAALGFLTRRLPENFNESWFIFVSVSTTLFMWAVFLPTYFSAFYAYHQAALMALCLLFNVYVTLAVQFGPRVYALYYIQDDKINFGTTTATLSIEPTEMSASN